MALWLLVHPAGGSDALALRKALADRLSKGATVAVAEINDYEARRELLRRGATRQILNLEQLEDGANYYSIDTALMESAASLWAMLRSKGKAGADDKGLDGDVILAAQALRFTEHLIVSDNVKHFKEICNAQTLAEFVSPPSSGTTSTGP